jgi:maltose alpha-D-glucosyltransferase/alpha-amylase
MRVYIDARKSDAILIAEANIKPDKFSVYMNHGQRMHALFNFYINQHLFLSLARGRATHLANALKKLPVTGNNQWLQFLRHHDELSLKLLTDKQREEVFLQFAPEKTMQIYGKGIRRRLAPMLDWNHRVMKMAFSLMFSLPGIPLLRYGDEIGMGDDLSLPGRESMRTPMQWANRANGGFSNAPGKKLSHPAITGSRGYQHINVLDFQSTPTSFLNWMKLLISARKQCQEIIEQPVSTIDTRYKNILAHTYKDNKYWLLLLHNLSDKPVRLQKKELGVTGMQLHNLLMDDETGENDEEILLNPYGFKWLKTFI